MSTTNERAMECWARCELCGVDFRIGVSVPCPLDVYVAALKVTRCPNCGKKGKNLSAYIAEIEVTREGPNPKFSNPKHPVRHQSARETARRKKRQRAVA